MGRLIICDQTEEQGNKLEFSELQPEYLVGREALFGVLEQGDVEAVVLRSRGDDPEAHLCLRQLALRWPWVIRIQQSMEATARYQAEGGDVADASLPYNAEASRIEFIIERTRPMIARLRNPALEAIMVELGELPPLPEQLTGLNQMIDEQANESTASVAHLFRGCMPYLKQLMELLNNPLLGCSRHLFSVNEAVRLVGLRTLRDLGIMAHIINTFPQPEGWSSFSFEHLLSRNLVCAHLADRIAHSVGSDRVSMSSALAAGLFHDFGMRVLVRLDQPRYFRVMEKAAALNQPVYAVEKLDYKLTHGELGASILRRWGVSPRIVRAVLYHHVPKAAGDNTFTTLTAAHVADAMLPPLFNAMECLLGGRLSLGYLDSIGEMEHVSLWERLASDHRKQLEVHW